MTAPGEDAAGYTTQDFRTATRLQALAGAVRDRWAGTVSEMGRRLTDHADLTAALDDLPGWGPRTVGLFLRELRGVWPGAHLPLDARGADAARHIRIRGETDDGLERLGAIATRAAWTPATSKRRSWGWRSATGISPTAPAAAPASPSTHPPPTQPASNATASADLTEKGRCARR